MDDETAISLVKKVALEIRSKLPHTPINGVGHNFIFSLAAKEPLDSQCSEQDQVLTRNVAKKLGEKVMLASCSHKTSFPTDKGYTLNITERHKTSEKSIGFNFHYEVKKGSMDDNALTPFEENYHIAKELSVSFGANND